MDSMTIDAELQGVARSLVKVIRKHNLFLDSAISSLHYSTEIMLRVDKAIHGEGQELPDDLFRRLTD